MTIFCAMSRGQKFVQGHVVANCYNIFMCHFVAKKNSGLWAQAKFAKTDWGGEGLHILVSFAKSLSYLPMALFVFENFMQPHMADK